MPPDEFVNKYDLNSVDKRLTAEISETRKTLDEHTAILARLETMYSSLESLPTTISNLDKTITLIGANLDSMDKSLNEVKESVSKQGYSIDTLRAENKKQNENISKIDGKSKIDWAVFVTENFWKLFAIIAAVYVFIQTYSKG